MKKSYHSIADPAVLATTILDSEFLVCAAPFDVIVQAPLVWMRPNWWPVGRRPQAFGGPRVVRVVSAVGAACVDLVLQVEPIRPTSVNIYVDDGDGDSPQAHIRWPTGHAFYLAAASSPVWTGSRCGPP
jgi:hypothetical protein